MRKMLLSLALATVATMSLASCGSATDKDNIPLTLSSMELDGVFNPFYATAQPDSEILSNTQISMLTNTPDGKPAFGENEAVVVQDLEETNNGGTQDVDLKTTYSFVLKNNIKFSNGSPLTIKDVLFNLYVYLDPVYTGSSTIYSTDIVGLKEYRTQEADENEQDSFMEQFVLLAQDRINYLIQAGTEVLDDSDHTLNVEEFRTQLQVYTEDAGYENVLKDFDKAYELFTEELNNDYNFAKGTASSIKFKPVDGPSVSPLKTDTEAFLYNEGYIYYDKYEGQVICTIGDLNEVKSWNQETAVNKVLQTKMPLDFEEVVTYWNTGIKLLDFLTNEELSIFNESMTEKKFPNISGIRFANKDEAYTVNGTTYQKPEYNEDGSLKEGFNEILTITINNVDPKAIWNFGFPVAPMYYYSDEEHIQAFDYEKNFGVQYGDAKWYESVVKASEKTGVPVGAGPYMAAKATGGTDNVKSGDFRDKGVVYYEANPNFILGEPKIKLLRYKVIAQSNLLNSLINSEIDFVQPNADPETIKQVEGMKNKGIEGQKVRTSGYGYIGINASKVPSRFVRMVIMHSIDTSLCVSFYGGTAQAVHRSMSRASWAYPEGATPYYPYLEGPIPEDLSVVSPYYAEFVENNGLQPGQTMTDAQVSEFIRWMLEEAPMIYDDQDGYTLNGNGVYQEGKNVCKLTFTIAGSETDHPAWQAMFKASEILNANGFEIIVANDAQALKKLNSGDLAVWAAAWGSTIDPDLYQIYHMDSKATSVNNWGYKAILQNTGNKYDFEYNKVVELSEKIEEGRSITKQSERALIYKDALDMVMELAVELPTYQRDDLFAYNARKIDKTTLVQDVSPFNGLLSRIWDVNLVQ